MAKQAFLSSRIFDSKCREGFPDSRERIFGYLLGPVGAQLLYFIVQTWLNVFYTDVLGLTQLNPDFLFYFPLVSMVFVVLFNVLFGWLIDRTKSKQGKARPYILLSSLLLPVSGILLFAIPTGNPTLEYACVCLSYNLFFSISFAIYNSSYYLLVPLSSRNSKTRNSLSTLANLGMMIAQTLGSLFPTLVYPFIGTDKRLWFFAMMGISLFSFPFLLLQYYHTRERVTEESGAGEAEEKVPYKRQLRAVVRDRYWWILIAYTFIFQLGLALKNSSVAYYCNWVIGARYNDGYTMLLFNIVGGLSLAIGAAVITPLTKRFTKRSLMLVGFILYALGDAICFVISYPGLFALPKSAILTVVLIGQFIKNAGGVPCVYIWMSLVADVLDHLEWKYRFRCDGLTISTTTIFTLFMPIIGNAVVNKILSGFGYLLPVTGLEVQSRSLQVAFDFLTVGAEGIASVIIVGLMAFFGVEKNILREQREIQARKKEAVLASGGVYLTPEEKEQNDEREFRKAQEEMELAALRKKCEKKGLSFEEEKAKYDEGRKKK